MKKNHIDRYCYSFGVFCARCIRRRTVKVYDLYQTLEENYANQEFYSRYQVGSD